MNSYFASVEQQANPFLRGKPIAITGKSQERSVVTTASIEAKTLGVKTAMSTWEAKKICPSLIMYPGDPQKYSDITQRFNRIFAEFTPNISQFSVDESFLDITEEAEDYFGATCIAMSIRERLKQECGEHITASIGIAPNRLMAKLACERVKPNGLTVTKPAQVLSLLDKAKLQDLCGIGPRINNRLENLGITNFKQLREYPKEQLELEFNSYGTWLHEASWGRESDAINASTQKSIRSFRSTDVKSYGHSYTLPQNTNNKTLLKRYLLALSDKVGWRMRRDGVTAKRISIIVRYEDFSSHKEQRTFKEATADGLNLYQIAWNILKPHIETTNTYNTHQPIRLIGISASTLQTDPHQTSLFKKEQKIQSVLSSLDTLQHRYGSDVWKRASTLPINFKTRSSGFHFDHEV
jgi:DNA polymerase IV